jgi:hypothetical protein
MVRLTLTLFCKLFRNRIDTSNRAQQILTMRDEKIRRIRCLADWPTVVVASVGTIIMPKCPACVFAALSAAGISVPIAAGIDVNRPYQWFVLLVLGGVVIRLGFTRHKNSTLLAIVGLTAHYGGKLALDQSGLALCGLAVFCGALIWKALVIRRSARDCSRHLRQMTCANTSYPEIEPDSTALDDREQLR